MRPPNLTSSNSLKLKNNSHRRILLDMIVVIPSVETTFRKSDNLGYLKTRLTELSASLYSNETGILPPAAVKNEKLNFTCGAVSVRKNDKLRW